MEGSITVTAEDAAEIDATLTRMEATAYATVARLEELVAALVADREATEAGDG